MAPGKRKATSGPGSRPRAPVAPGPSRFLPCPTCGKSFLARALQQHAWDCGTDRTRQQQQQSCAGAKRREAPDTLVLCPMCSRMFPQHAIESHAWECRPPPADDGAMSTVPSSTGRASATEAACNTMLDNSGEFQARHHTTELQPKTTAAGTYLIPAEGGNSNCADRGAPKQVPQESEGKNAMQTLMEGGKRAVKAEREEKIIPRAWPVECVEDLLPRDKAEGLLARMLQLSRDWTSQTWFNANGLEGRTHSRSCAYRIPAAGDSRSRGRASEGAMKQESESDPEAQDKWKVSTDEDRRATHEEGMDKSSAVAPAELLDVVPLVVEVVRRRQRQRMEDGLAGSEGLRWNPNYCICHVYDDHRSHLGAHSDTLSNIGPRAIVVGVSLGAKRVFVVEETLPRGVKPPPAGSGSEGGKKSLDMPHNCAIVMWAGCQERYKHGVPVMSKGVGTHPMSGTKRIGITLRERKESLPSCLLPVPDCRCRVPASLKAGVKRNGQVEYLYQCDRGQGQCGFWLSKGPLR
ncbi:unnamed protein product [Ectocarpus sp. 6 AP-2014]